MLLSLEMEVARAEAGCRARGCVVDYAVDHDRGAVLMRHGARLEDAPVAGEGVRGAVSRRAPIVAWLERHHAADALPVDMPDPTAGQWVGEGR